MSIPKKNPPDPLYGGSCVATIPVIALPMQVAANTAFTPLPIHCEPSLIGASLELQGLVLGLASTCPIAGGVSLSDRHTMTIGT